ncbi:hypothetical protein WHI96_08060 [Pseudonocardia tropica]|uniref:Uncharacterized protein n=1 Tax=Pseudonocardia tropica TaxID=681289 RepID=A0ABV1JUE8_9PSEU
MTPPPWAQNPPPRKQPIGLLPKILFGATALLALFVVIVGVVAYQGGGSPAPSSSVGASTTTPLGCTPIDSDETSWERCTHRTIAAMPWCGQDIPSTPARKISTPGRPTGGHWVTAYQTSTGAVTFQIFATSSQQFMTIDCPTGSRRLDEGDLLSISKAGPPETMPLVLR